MIHQNALELQRRGHSVSVVASNLLNKHRRIAPGTFQRSLDGLNVHYLHTYNLARWPGTLGPTWLAPAAKRYLRGLIADANVVHVNATRNAVAFEAMRQAQKQGVPLVVQPHGTLPHIVNSKRLKWLFDTIFLRRTLTAADAFIALQAAEVEQIAAAGGRRERIHIVPNGLRVGRAELRSRQYGFRRKFKIPAQHKIILFLGRINHKKGVDILVEAFAQIPEEARRRLQLVIAGPDDGQLGEVQALVRRHRLAGNVLFTGLLEGDDVWAAHVDADLFVLPCRIDTFPMVIIEACAAGTPMVVSETCEIADLLADKAATIAAPAPRAIGAAMQALLADDELQQHYRRGAAELIATTFSMRAVGDRLERIYGQVAAV